MNITRESIFASSVRSFFTAFCAILGVLIAIILVVFGLGSLSQSSMLPEKSDVTIAPDAMGNRDLLPMSSPAILRLDFHGVIGMGDLTGDNLRNVLLDSRDGFLKDNRVKAVLLHLDTPGGTVTDADEIYQALMAYKKQYQIPIYAFVEGLCASGGMYIASAADKVYATLPSTIGSIGVIMGPTFNFSQLMDKVGVQSMTLTEGKDKDMLNPFRPWKEGEDQSLRNIIASMYNNFVTVVTTARPHLDREKLVNEYGAQVFIAAEAQKLGYIDVADSNYGAALGDLVRAANIGEDVAYQVVNLTPPHSLLSCFTDENQSILRGKVTHVLQMSPTQHSELSGKFLYLYQPESLSH